MGMILETGAKGKEFKLLYRQRGFEELMKLFIMITVRLGSLEFPVKPLKNERAHVLAREPLDWAVSLKSRKSQSLKRSPLPLWVSSYDKEPSQQKTPTGRI